MNSTCFVPEIGKKSQGIGVVTLSARREKNPQNGVRVSLRKEGKIVGSDVTTGAGEVSCPGDVPETIPASSRTGPRC